MAETVYISSTYNDLKNFRQAVINCIVSLGDYYKPVSMEFYDSEDIHFVKKCMDDVEACDIYILILGKRYGYIPKGFTKSITELEYERARLCQQNGKKIEILVFKVGDLSATYQYKENDPAFVEYQQNFLDDINERLSPKPFDSEPELSLQVSLSLMKRLFRLVRTGEKIIPPDKDSVLCYCDRNIPITDLKTSVSRKQKKIFFLQGNRIADIPGGIIKRFVKYSLGYTKKIEPLVKITGLFTSNDKESNYVNAFSAILEYLNRPVPETNLDAEACFAELTLVKSSKILIPFYFDFEFAEDSNKIYDFLVFADQLFREFEKKVREYQLFFIIVIYSEQPDKAAVSAVLEKYDVLKSRAVYIDRLKQVPDNDIIDWLEKYITTIDFSTALYQEYFSGENKKLYNMKDVNIKLGEIIEDLGNGKENIKKYL